MQPTRLAPRNACGLVTAALAGAFTLVAVPAAGAQVTEAINRARAAEAQASKRNEAVNQQAQQATQEGKPGAKPAPAQDPKGKPAPAQDPKEKAAPAAAEPAPRRPQMAPRLSGGGAPAAGPAAPGGTHTVEKGETLWGIARQHLNDPYLWPEIYRLNTDVVEDPRWIYPGEVLKLPGAQPATVAAAPAEAGQPAVPVTREAPVQEAEAPEANTVFSSFSRVSGTSRREGTIPRSAPAVRSGEFTSAPFATPANGPAWSGRVIESVATASVNVVREDRAFQLAEPVSITPPSGAPAVVGSRYLVIRPGPTVAGVGQIVIPTGVVRVQTVERGKSPVAEVTQIFDAMRPGQGLIPYERIRLDTLARPSAVANGPLTSVQFLLSDPVLPTIQAYLVLGNKGVPNVKLGDVFALIRPAAPGAGGAQVPEETIATAQVVRVTAQGITAVLTGQTTGAIKVGTPARLAARMP